MTDSDFDDNDGTWTTLPVLRADRTCSGRCGSCNCSYVWRALRADTNADTAGTPTTPERTRSAPTSPPPAPKKQRPARRRLVRRRLSYDAYADHVPPINLRQASDRWLIVD